MLIWFLVLVLALAFAASGFFAGAVRTLVSYIGFFLGLVLAMPLGNLTKPLFAKAGIVSPVWMFVLPPLTMFLLVGLVVFGLSFLVHKMADTHFKFRADDVGYLSWVRLNQRVGAALGVGLGLMHAVLILWIVYVTGYATVQIASDDSAPGGVAQLNSLRTSLKESGLDRVVAAFDKTPEKYYQAADVLALIYHNPLVQGRLASYPPYIPLASMPEFQDLATDTEYQQMLQTGGSVGAFLEHPKTQAILANRDLLEQVAAVDLKDLRAYLETGKSPKYQDEKILGRWTLDAYATLLMAKRVNPEMSASQMSLLRKVLTTIAPYFTLAASPDKKLVMSFKGADEAVQKLVESLAPVAAAAPAAGAAPAAPAMDPVLAQRYGLNRGGRAGGPPPGAIPGAAPAEDGSTPAAARQPNPASRLIAKLAFSATGTWESTGIRYEAAVQDEKGGSMKLQIQAKDDELFAMGPDKNNMVFLRME